MRYIGSKARVANAIVDLVGVPQPGSVFVDAFCGTGSVAAEAARRGWPVRINDHLRSAALLARARLLCVGDVPFRPLGGYARAVAGLQAAQSRRGFVWRQYSPASRESVGFERKYFTEENAAAIDGMRHQIGAWRLEGLISDVEEGLLVADLLAAASQVANTAGTYGCYLATWNPSALRKLALAPRALGTTPLPHEFLVGDVWDVPFCEGDVAYFDPPYTKRQYAAYYHILETIAIGDEPEVLGLTGLRPWQELASDFCYKSKALTAIAALVDNVSASRVFLSYSNEGHVPLDILGRVLGSFGTVQVHEVAEVGRYRPNSAASANGSSVSECVIEVTKSEILVEPLEVEFVA